MAQTARGLSSIRQKLPTDVVILSSLRTPVTRAYKGGFRSAYDHELLSHVLKATLAANPNLDPSLIDDVAVGVVLAELGGSKAARMAQLHAGFSDRTALHTINRACSSGLAAVTSIGNMIASGQISVGVGAGMESMTRNYGSRAIPENLWEELRTSSRQDAQDCIMPMGLTSENVAKRYNVSRADQDAFAAESHKRASQAQKGGLFDGEIVPVSVLQSNLENPEATPTEKVTVSQDDGIRHDISVEKMAKLKPAFAKDGSSTAGNSSQVSDGAAATLLIRRSTANELGLSSSIIGKWVATQTVGCKPDEMGIGPAVAIPKLLEFTGTKTDDVSIWEINEAFASQALYSIRKLGLENKMDKVNPRGGGIALGHPLGMTGVRQLATLMPQLSEGEVGVVSMCIGTGMGMAGMFVRE
jgi:acetyl-CoA acyltransferase 1